MIGAVKKVGEFFLDVVETLVIAMSIFLVIYLFFMQPHQVNGHSMDPTFETGQYLLTDKVSYRLGEPKRGDVVVFHAPEAAQCPAGTGCDFIKRVIGVPGETITFQGGQFYINGEPLAESYIGPNYPNTGGAFINGRTVTLGPNEYFVVGDNRPGSSDSRAWGPIERADIVGRAFFSYWPTSRMGLIKDVTYLN